jgi:hypothetical protein
MDLAYFVFVEHPTRAIEKSWLDQSTRRGGRQEPSLIEDDVRPLLRRYYWRKKYQHIRDRDKGLCNTYHRLKYHIIASPHMPLAGFS